MRTIESSTRRATNWNGLRPIDYLKATHPVVIMDEPQNMESKLSKTSIAELDLIATLRFSATHRRQRNVVYRLDPVDAHDLGLVKQIVVAEVAQQGADATPYIKVVEVRRDPWEAKLELSVRTADGSLTRRVVRARQDQELSNLTNNPAYEGWWITELSIEPQFVELNKHGMLGQGEEIGGNAESIYRGDDPRDDQGALPQADDAGQQGHQGTQSVLHRQGRALPWRRGEQQRC